MAIFVSSSRITGRSPESQMVGAYKEIYLESGVKSGAMPCLHWNGIHLYLIGFGFVYMSTQIHGVLSIIQEMPDLVSRAHGWTAVGLSMEK